MSLPTASAVANAEPDCRPASHWTDWGQWLALATMSVDHIVRYLAPETWSLGWASASIGRIAFPLFAAMVAWHGLFNTRNPMRYARRILMIGLFAQLPYMAMPRDGFQLNICFTLALSVMGTYGLRTLVSQAEEERSFLSWNILAAGAILMAWAILGSWVEYGHRGLLLVPAYMLAFRAWHRSMPSLGSWTARLGASLPVLVIAAMMNSSIMAKSFTLATVLIMLMLAAGAARHVPTVALRMPRQLWLAWYPAHFAAIAVLLHRNWPGGWLA